MVEKTAIGHSKIINEDAEFIVTKTAHQIQVPNQVPNNTKLQHKDQSVIIPMEALSGAAH